ncbi:MAG: hypothetical protein R2822_09705 [Spirosomataceae bacterium]
MGEIFAVLFWITKHATTEELLKIGDDIWDCLSAHGKVQEWLDIFDNALPEYRELILAIKALGVPIATANYDNLLEDITHLTPITLQEIQKVEDFIKNDQNKSTFCICMVIIKSLILLFWDKNHTTELCKMSLLNSLIATLLRLMIPLFLWVLAKVFMTKILA